MVVEALTRLVMYVHDLWKLPFQRYTRLAFESSCQLALEGDPRCWYAQMASWFQLHGFSMDRLPPFQYSLDAPSHALIRLEISRIIRQDLTLLDIQRTWLSPSKELGTKMALYREHFLHTFEEGFIIRPRYMNSHLSHGLQCVIGQLRTSSHQLHIGQADTPRHLQRRGYASYVTLSQSQ